MRIALEANPSPVPSENERKHRLRRLSRAARRGDSGLD